MLGIVTLSLLYTVTIFAAQSETLGDCVKILIFAS